MSGDGKTLQTYYAELENGLGRIGEDLDGIVGVLQAEVGPRADRMNVQVWGFAQKVNPALWSVYDVGFLFGVASQRSC